MPCHRAFGRAFGQPQARSARIDERENKKLEFLLPNPRSRRGGESFVEESGALGEALFSSNFF